MTCSEWESPVGSLGSRLCLFWRAGWVQGKGFKSKHRMWHAKNNHPDYRIKQKFGLGWQDERTLLGTVLNGTESLRVITDRAHRHLILKKTEELPVFHYHHHHPLTTGANRAFMEIPSQTPWFTIITLRSLISSPESLAVTLGYASLRDCTLPTGYQKMRDEIISLSAR